MPHDSLHAQEYGKNGPPMLLLHGLGGAGSTWTRVAGILAAEHRVLVPDLLGFGRSPRVDGGYTIEDHLDALLELVHDRGLDGRKLHVVGHSMGAILAAAFTARHPDSVAGLALVGLPVYRSGEQARQAGKGLGLMARLTLEEHWLPKLLCTFMCAFRPGFILIAPLLAPRVPAAVARDAFRHDRSSFFDSFEHVILDGDLDEILEQLAQKPVHVIHGELDEVAPVSEVHELSGRFPLWRFDFLAGVSHLLPIEKPDLLAGVLVK